jgi:hypothetical protein
MLAHLDLSNLTGDGRDNQQIAGGRILSSELGLPAKIAGSGRERYMSISMGRWKPSGVFGGSRGSTSSRDIQPAHARRLANVAIVFSPHLPKLRRSHANPIHSCSGRSSDKTIDDNYKASPITTALAAGGGLTRYRAIGKTSCTDGLLHAVEITSRLPINTPISRMHPFGWLEFYACRTSQDYCSCYALQRRSSGRFQCSVRHCLILVTERPCWTSDRLGPSHL